MKMVHGAIKKNLKDLWNPIKVINEEFNKKYTDEESIYPNEVTETTENPEGIGDLNNVKVEPKEHKCKCKHVKPSCKKDKVNTLKLRTNKNYEFVTIDNESERIYVFTNKEISIKNPLYINVGKEGHRILDLSGVAHYIPEGWLQIKMIIKRKANHFVI